MSGTAVVPGRVVPRHPSLLLMRNTPARLASVELFAGAGGLALGCQEAGFDALATLELDKWACDTVRQNQARGHKLVANWHVEECDVRDFNWSRITDEVDLLAGGPPCQPFSIGGHGKADDDERDMFPATAEAVAHLRPRAFIIENVRGLARPRFADYFQYIQARLSMPLLTAKPGELWADHLRRLQDARKDIGNQELAYRVTCGLRQRGGLRSTATATARLPGRFPKRSRRDLGVSACHALEESATTFPVDHW